MTAVPTSKRMPSRASACVTSFQPLQIMPPRLKVAPRSTNRIIQRSSRDIVLPGNAFDSTSGVLTLS